MRKIGYLLFLIPIILTAQGPVVRSNYTVATLPSVSANNGAVRIITDGASSSDCTVGSGSSVNFCRSNGAAWVIISTSGGGGATIPSVTNLIDGDGAGNGHDSGVAASNVGLKNGNLGQFASTTSAQLATVISDESGTGLLVYNNSPTFLGTPTAPTPAASDNSTTVSTTAYVTTAIANAVSTVPYAVAVQVATAAVLPNSPNYSNGVSGVGATLTSTTMTALVVDGYTVLLNDRILVKNQVTAANNGCYVQTTLGTGAVFWILTRCTDFNTPTEMNNSGVIPVDNNGTVNARTGWYLTSIITTVGTDALNFTQFSVNAANIVTAVSPGAGLCHFAGSTQTCTSSAVVNADVTSIDGATKITGILPNSNLPTLTYTPSVFGGANLIPDSSGNVFAEPYTILSGTAFFAYNIMAFADTSTVDCMFTRFNVPINYTSTTTTWIIDWTTTATSGNAIWTLDYRDVSTATLAATTSQESLTVTTAASGTASARTQSSMTATAGNFSAGDIVQIKVCRNGAGSDTIAATLAVHDIRFSYVGRP